MTARPASKAVIKRAIAAVTAAGLTVRAVHIAGDGSVSIDTDPHAGSAKMDKPAEIGNPGPKQWASR